MADNDAIVIGSGPGGYGCAIRCVELDSRPRAPTAAGPSAIGAILDMTSYLSSRVYFLTTEQKQRLTSLLTAGPHDKTNGETHG
jgi:hypothetical protein